MAEVEKDIVIKVKAVDEASAPIKGLEEQLNDVKQQMLALAQAGKQNTAEFNKLAQEAGGLKAKIEGVEKSVDGFMKTQSRVELFGSAVAGIAAGFAVAQGAAALFGEENEDLQKSIMKLQGAMALLAGVQQLVELTRRENIIGAKLAAAAQSVYTFAVGGSTTALKAFRIALVATGIGAFVVALGLAAEAMGLFNSKAEDAADDQKDLNRALNETVGTLEFYERKLKAFGTTDEQLAAIRIKRYQQDRANIQKNLDDAVAAEGKRQNAYQNAARQELELLDVKIREEQNIIDKGIADREAAEAAARARRLEERKREFEQQKKDNEVEYMQLIDGFKQYYDKLVASNTLGEMQIRGERRFSVEDLMAQRKREEALEDMRKQRQIDREKQTLQGIADLATLFAGKSEKAQRRAFDINKKASMATAIIDGISATQKAFKSAPPPLSYVLAAAAAAAALVRVKAISKQQFQSPSVGGGGGGVGGESSAPPTTAGFASGGGAMNPNSQLLNPNQGAGNGQGQEMRAYVVESDVRTVSGRLRRISEFAQLGN